MESNIKDMLEKVVDEIKSSARTETVVGKEFKLGEFTCVPIIKIGLGFGGGSATGDSNARGKSDAAGAGAGIGITPIGFLVSRGDHIQILNVDQSKGLNQVIERSPELVERLINKFTSGKTSQGPEYE